MGGDLVIRVQSGPRNARTDPETGLRFYHWQGRDLPSVTTIRRMAGLPHGLHQWALGRVITHAVAHLDDFNVRLDAAAERDEFSGVAEDHSEQSAQTIAIIHELRQSATAERDAAAKLGMDVHDAAATGKRPEDVPLALRPRLSQYIDFLDVSGAEVLLSEFQVFSPEVGYAGSADLLVRFTNGRVFLIDLKTGKGTWPEHALQVSAYRHGELVGQDDVVDERATALLREVSGIAILHLSDPGWELRVIRDDADTWRAFRGLLLFSTWLHGHSRIEDVTLSSRKGSSGRAF